jgi:hypothetical protein
MRLLWRDIPYHTATYLPAPERYRIGLDQSGRESETRIMRNRMTGGPV